MHRVLVWLMVGLALGGAGCRSIYHRSHALLPPDPCAQLELRVQEARGAEKSAEAAGAKLRDRLGRGLPRDAIEADMDRVEAAALEMDRRAACAQDATARCQGQAQLAAEIERLQRRSRELLVCVQSVRRTGTATSASLLDDFLGRPAQP